MGTFKKETQEIQNCANGTEKMGVYPLSLQNSLDTQKLFFVSYQRP